MIYVDPSAPQGAQTDACAECTNNASKGPATPFNRAVYEYLKTVPKGKVVTYGQVARAIGAPRASRQVGRALHINPQPGIIPCHRVVFKDGSLAPAFAFGGMQIQAELLRSEGVEVTGGKVDLAKYGWKE
ncbi:MAG: MGMT family protein [Clostridia bacterium]|nr:MGMT family protein [Clostridia bacterium]